MTKRIIRKRFIIGGLCLFLTSLLYVIQSNGAFADITEGRRCKTMFNGECTEYYAPTSNQENTLQNINQSQNLETYNSTPYKYLPQMITSKRCRKSFGFNIILDPYQNVWSTWDVYNQSKIFIANIEANSPAQKAGLKVGDEILRINGTRAVKFKDTDAVISYMNENSKLELQIRSRGGGKENVVLSVGNICTTERYDPLLETYWSQVTDKNVDYNTFRYLEGVEKITGKLTPQMRSVFYKYRNEVNNLAGKKISFKNGYQLCVNNAVSEQSLHYCLSNLVNRSLGIITHERNMQAQQENVNAINRHSYALRNQNVNVYHSGNVDVNLVEW